MPLSRRTLIRASGATLLPLSTPSVGRAADMRTLRFVPQANLSVLDPVFTTAAGATHEISCRFCAEFLGYPARSLSM
jgi:peptide/nickel transport system substrate-binding protein